MILVISDPEPIDEEHEIINALFDEGLELFHLRKPGYSEEQIRHLLKQINNKYYPKISLHQYHYLGSEFGINRLHFSEKNRTTLKIENQKESLIYSTSMHNKEDFFNMDFFNYCFYGPVFDSISKEGYKKMRSIDLSEIRKIYTKKIIGIGGINKDNISVLKEKEYDGAALLGYIWMSPKDALTNFNRIKNAWKK